MSIDTHNSTMKGAREGGEEGKSRRRIGGTRRGDGKKNGEKRR